MNGNFDWQQQQVNERVSDALKEAAGRRLAKQAGSRNRAVRRGGRAGSTATILRAAFVLGAASFVISLVLSG
jgi:hypothetical protein